MSDDITLSLQALMSLWKSKGTSEISQRLYAVHVDCLIKFIDVLSQLKYKPKKNSNTAIVLIFPY